MPEQLGTRRNFLFGRADQPRYVPRPPGISSESLSACTACGICVDQCPQNIITLVAGGPELDFARGECTFCGLCAERCPEPVFVADPVLKFPHSIKLTDNCLATNYVDCQACRDVCPTNAIRFRPRLGGPFQPHLELDLCTGCGACLSVCPTASIELVETTKEAALA